jgi:pre-rRNA-processing protein TSR1
MVKKWYLLGSYVTIQLTEVPSASISRLVSEGRLTVFSLLRHEFKMSVLHATIQRTSNYTEPIKSKDRLIVQVRNSE